MSIGKKYSILIITLILISSGSIAFYGITTSTTVVTETSEESIYRTADQASDRLDEWLAGRVDLLNELSREDGVASMDIEEQREVLEGEAERLGFLDLGIVEPDEVGYTQYIEDQEAEAELGDRDYVKTALEGNLNSSNIIISRVIGEAVLMHAAPIEEDGEIVGVLIARDLAETIQDITEGLAYGELGYSYILNTDGDLQIHPDMNRVEEGHNIYDDEGYEDVAESIASLEGQDGVVDYAFEGNVRYQGVSFLENNDWLLAVGTEDTEFLAPVRNARSNIMLFTVGLALVFALASYFTLNKFIARPIKDLTEINNRLSQYDFTSHEDHEITKYLKRKDEIGQITNALGAMQNNIVNLVKGINEKAEQVASSSEELSANTEENTNAANEVSKAVEDIASGASDQAESTESASEKAEEFGKMIEENQQYMKNLNESAEKADQLKDEGTQIMGELTERTQENTDASKQVQEAVTEIKNSTGQIEKATGMISDISEQTNLLALNAAIEAARAGEAGKGFAVVAEEIRKLAEQSNEYTEEIKGVINELAQKSENSVKAMEKANKAVEEQTQSVESSKERFDGIAASIQEMKDIIASLNETGEQMEQKKQGIIDNLQNLSAIAQENSSNTEEISSSVEEQTASMEEIAKASESLAKLAEEMQEEVSKFKY